ncbi:MAG TPA: PorV/PorQ family protein [Candidatus Saccharimonadales bacterium]|nr:PorV/PorQ family protein [Candidatus Saccharimonadales bacterium]
MRSWFPRSLCLTVCLLAAALPASAQIGGGGASLFITPSARADGMGRAFVSLADDPSAMFWNPAGLGFIEHPEAMTNYAKLVPGLADDVFHLYLAYIAHSQNWGTFGGSITYLSYGKSTISAADPTSGEAESLGTFTSYELAPMLSFGTALSHDLAIGFSVKLLYVDLAPHYALVESGVATSKDVNGTGTSVAVDFGALARHTVKIGQSQLELGAGAVVQNLGPSISFVDQANKDPLPRNYILGVSTRLHLQPGTSVALAVNMQKYIIPTGSDTIPGEPIHWHLGAEVVAANTLAGRVGFIHDPGGEISAMTYGLGILINKLQLDFASVPQAYDQRVKKFSLTVKF